MPPLNKLVNGLYRTLFASKVSHGTPAHHKELAVAAHAAISRVPSTDQVAGEQSNAPPEENWDDFVFVTPPTRRIAAQPVEKKYSTPRSRKPYAGRPALSMILEGDESEPVNQSPGGNATRTLRRMASFRRPPLPLNQAVSVLAARRASDTMHDRLSTFAIQLPRKLASPHFFPR